jgi:hypothetical protein
VAKHDNLEVLGTTRADRETGDHGDEAVENARHSWSASAVFPLIAAHDRRFGPQGLPVLLNMYKMKRLVNPVLCLETSRYINCLGLNVDERYAACG